MLRRAADRLFQIAAILAVAGSATAQASDAAQERATPVLRPHTAAEARIGLPIRCQSKTPGACATLLAQDVALRIDGNLVPPQNISITHAPADFVVVLDGINTPLEDLVRSRNTVAAFLAAQQPPRTTVLLVTETRPRFHGNQPANVGGWELTKNELYVGRITGSIAELNRALLAWEPSLPRTYSAQAEPGGSARVRNSLQSLSFIAAALRNEPAMKSIAWISPGWPTVHMTRGGYNGQVFDSLIYFDDALRTGNIILSALDPTGAATDRAVTGEPAPPPTRDDLRHTPSLGGAEGYFGAQAYREFLRPARTEREADPNNLLLPVLAIHSGGFVQSNTNDPRPALQRAATQAAEWMELNIPVSSLRSKNAWHTTAIAPNHQPIQIETRTGFYVR